MNANNNKSKQQTFDKYGIQYIFAYKTENGWRFPRHRFQIANPETQMGQFISSIWYADVCPLSKNLEFLVVGVKGNINYNLITSLVNGSQLSYGINRLSDLEKSSGIQFKDYYCYTSSECTVLYNNNKNHNGNFALSLKGNIFCSVLTLNVMCIKEGIYNTTPSFIIENESEKEDLYENDTN